MKARKKKRIYIIRQIALAHSIGPTYIDVLRAFKTPDIQLVYQMPLKKAA
jgi:hypothetical protein